MQERVRPDQRWPVSSAAATAFLWALGADDGTVLAAWLKQERPGGAWLAWVRRQGLAPFAFHNLQREQLLSELPERAAMLLRTDYYQEAGASAIRRAELARVLAALASAGVESVLLKGTALVYTVYPDPLCRPMGDVDVWVQPEDAPTASAALEGIGYRGETKADRPPALAALIGGEIQMSAGRPGSGLVELQWPAWRGEWYRHTALTDYAAVWQRRQPVAIETHPAYVMAREDQLIHLCLHEALNHHFAEPWLRSLLDVHLTAQKQPPDWRLLVERVAAWRLATPVWTMLSLAAELFGTPVPEWVLEALAPSAGHRRAIAELHLSEGFIAMRPDSYGYRRLLIQWSMADRARDAGRLSWYMLFPDSQWLRARYGVSTPGGLARARLTHPLRLIVSARA